MDGTFHVAGEGEGRRVSHVDNYHRAVEKEKEEGLCAVA